MVEENNTTTNNSYERQFEKLQRLKGDLEDNFQLEQYKEDRDYFYAKNHKVRRRRYVERNHRLQQLRERRRALYDRYMTLRGLYLRSRADTAYDDELRANFEEVRRVNEELEALKRAHEERPDEVFDRLDENAKDEEEGAAAAAPPVAPVASASSEKEEGKSKKKQSSSSKSKTPKGKRVKSFLFKTYAKCAEAKRSDPEYMSKEAIIAHIKEHYPEMLRQLPKNLRKMKREEICKVIFK